VAETSTPVVVVLVENIVFCRFCRSMIVEVLYFFVLWGCKIRRHNHSNHSSPICLFFSTIH
jgi:hypothetical protein